MIVRILGEGQFELEQDKIAPLEELDQQLVAALDAGDEATFADVLDRLLATVRSEGVPVGSDRFVPSVLTLPHAHATIADVRELLASEDAGES